MLVYVIISFLLWTFIVAPLWGLTMSTFDNLGIVLIFTVSAIARGYIWRRFFNKGIHKVIHKWVKSNARLDMIFNKGIHKSIHEWVKMKLAILLGKLL